MLAIKYAREQKIPFLGICLGFQLAVIEWARNVLEISGILILIVYCPFPDDVYRRNFDGIHTRRQAPHHHFHAGDIEDPYGRHDASGAPAHCIRERDGDVVTSTEIVWRGSEDLGEAQAPIRSQPKIRRATQRLWTCVCGQR